MACNPLSSGEVRNEENSDNTTFYALSPPAPLQASRRWVCSAAPRFRVPVIRSSKVVFHTARPRGGGQGGHQSHQVSPCALTRFIHILYPDCRLMNVRGRGRYTCAPTTIRRRQEDEYGNPNPKGCRVAWAWEWWLVRVISHHDISHHGTTVPAREVRVFFTRGASAGRRAARDGACHYSHG